MWFILALLAAFFTSVQDVLGKKLINKVDTEIIAWGWMFFSLPFLYVYLMAEGMPPIGPLFGKALAVSTVILIIASVLYFKAIKCSDLSLAMPMLAFTPIFLLITSPLILGEFPRPLGLAGIFLIVVGSYVLRFRDRSLGYLGPFKCLVRERGPRYMLIVAFLYSIGANMDKIGVLNSSPVMWIAMLNTLTALGLWLFYLRRAKNFWQQVKSVWLLLVFIGLFNAAAVIFQMIAIQMTIVPYLIAVKRTSVFMSALFGFFLFKEKGIKERSIGALLMVLGVVLIALV